MQKSVTEEKLTKQKKKKCTAFVKICHSFPVYITRRYTTTLDRVLWQKYSIYFFVPNTAAIDGNSYNGFSILFLLLLLLLERQLVDVVVWFLDLNCFCPTSFFCLSIALSARTNQNRNSRERQSVYNDDSVVGSAQRIRFDFPYDLCFELFFFIHWREIHLLFVRLSIIYTRVKVLYSVAISSTGIFFKWIK